MPLVLWTNSHDNHLPHTMRNGFVCEYVRWLCAPFVVLIPMNFNSFLSFFCRRWMAILLSGNECMFSVQCVHQFLEWRQTANSRWFRWKMKRTENERENRKLNAIELKANVETFSHFHLWFICRSCYNTAYLIRAHPFRLMILAPI